MAVSAADTGGNAESDDISIAAAKKSPILGVIQLCRIYRHLLFLQLQNFQLLLLYHIYNFLSIQRYIFVQIHITHKNFLQFQKFGEEFVLCNWKSTNFFTLLHLVLYFSPVNRHF